MAKTKTLIKQKKSSKNAPPLKLKSNALVRAYSPTKKLLDEDFMGRAILECLKNNDPKGVMEIISIYLETTNKVQSTKTLEMPRSTLYYSLKNKNPTIKTLAKLMSSEMVAVKK